MALAGLLCVWGPACMFNRCLVWIPLEYRWHFSFRFNSQKGHARYSTLMRIPEPASASNPIFSCSWMLVLHADTPLGCPERQSAVPTMAIKLPTCGRDQEGQLAARSAPAFVPELRQLVGKKGESQVCSETRWTANIASAPRVLRTLARLSLCLFGVCCDDAIWFMCVCACLARTAVCRVTSWRGEQGVLCFGGGVQTGGLAGA